jgi:hypothetical protein
MLSPVRTMRHSSRPFGPAPCAWLLVGLGLGGCDTERTRAAQEMAEAAGQRTAEAAQAAREWASGLGLGELSESAKTWLRRGASASASGIEAVLQKGEQVVPVALEIHRALSAAIDTDTAIEPIYQEVAGGPNELALRRAEADAAIRGMTRVEPIEGVQVGFKQLSSLDLGKQVSESAYLVMWRQDDRLVGFVLRSRREVAFDGLVREAPRLVALVRSVL